MTASAPAARSSVVWFLIFVIPLFLFTPDTVRRMSPRAAVRTGLASLRETLSGIRTQHSNIFRFLIAHMIYADGLAGLFAFGGLYASSIFDWGTTETLLFGVVVVFAAVPGAFLGGRLDDLLGSKRDHHRQHRPARPRLPCGAVDLR